MNARDVATTIADALDHFWNAALNATHGHSDATANAVMHGMVEGVAAVAGRLREALVAQDSSEGSGEAVAWRWMYFDGVPTPWATERFPTAETIHRAATHPHNPARIEYAYPTAQGEQKQRNAGDDARDAARYRWLRSEGFAIGDVAKLTPDTFGVGLDYAIDAAIAAQQRKGEQK